MASKDNYHTPHERCSWINNMFDQNLELVRVTYLSHHIGAWSLEFVCPTIKGLVVDIPVGNTTACHYKMKHVEWVSEKLSQVGRSGESVGDTEEEFCVEEFGRLLNQI